MSYEEKYRKYKKKYVDLKYHQAGGYDLNDAGDLAKNKIDSLKSTVDYDNIIAKLENFCKTNNTFDINFIKSKLANLRDTITNRQSDGNFLNWIPLDEATRKDFQDFIARHRDNLPDSKVIHAKLCQRINDHVIPSLKQQRDLKNRIVESLRNIKLPENVQINIDKFLDYAKEHKITTESVNEIIHKYYNTVQQYAEHFQRELTEKNIVESFIGSNPSVGTGGNAQWTLSKNGKICRTECEFNADKNKCTCQTDPYKTWFGLGKTRSWDECAPGHCAVHNPVNNN
jgi:hypothetical protein